MPDWLKEVLAHPTTTVTDTARALNIGRNQAYEAVKEGKIPCLRYGRRIVIPTAWLKRALLLEEVA